MSTNKYRRRRAMRTPTAGTKYQNEPIQAPLQKVEKSTSFNDLGREDARRIAEQNNPNTRYVDKPTATTSKRQLSDAMSRQQAVIRDAQRQVLGRRLQWREVFSCAEKVLSSVTMRMSHFTDQRNRIVVAYRIK